MCPPSRLAASTRSFEPRGHLLRPRLPPALPGDMPSAASLHFTTQLGQNRTENGVYFFLFRSPSSSHPPPVRHLSATFHTRPPARLPAAATRTNTTAAASPAPSAPKPPRGDIRTPAGFAGKAGEPRGGGITAVLASAYREPEPKSVKIKIKKEHQQKGGGGDRTTKNSGERVRG